MTKKKESLTIGVDLSNLFIEDSLKKKSVEGFPINQALATVTRQMEVTGFRERTISDYNLHVTHFAKITGVQVLDEITPEHIYEWLSSMSVSNQTKLTRLKCLKAFLGRCFDIGWISTKFWKSITIKVDSPVKTGASEKDIRLLLTLLDLADFVQLRDATAVLLMYQTGIRVGTLALLENKHVDLNAKLLKIDGGIIKNHQQILLPIDGDLIRLLTVLMSQNDLVRRDHRIRNNFVFITKNGGPVTTSPSNNNIQKWLNKYAKEYGLKNINPHALRRGFAKKLLDRGANVAVISRAMGMYSEENDINEVDLRMYDEGNVNNRNLEEGKVTIQRMVRNSKIAENLKEKYDNRCQLCNTRMRKANGNFKSEAHHIQPYNKTHRGDDNYHNMIVVCPNCHSQFDDYYYAIHPNTLVVHCIFEKEDDFHFKNLSIIDGHSLGKRYLEFAWKQFEEKKRLRHQ